MTFEALLFGCERAENSRVKTCSKCCAPRSISDYYKDKRASDGLYSHCKDCHKAILHAYSRSHPEVNRAGTARYRAKNPGAGKETRKIWATNNRERLVALQKAYAQRHPEKIRELVVRSTAKRKAQKLKAMPAWADEAEIGAIYREAQRKTREGVIVYHVDHVVPLISKVVCGLHVPANLRVTTESENTAKSNRYWPDMP